MKKLTSLLAILLFATYYSCSKDVTEDLTPKTDNIYILQNAFKGPKEYGVIQLYKNDTFTDITNKENDSWGIGMYINNNDVYILGTEKVDGSEEKTKVWKNGQELPLPINSNIHDITISGSDLYLLSQEYINNAYQIVVYKNNQPINITDGANDATPTKIKIIGSDTYILGTVFDGNHYVVTIWKNGVATNITDGSYNAFSNDLVVNNNEVYVLGREHNGTTTLPKLWKNGNEVPNFINDQFFRPVSLFVENDNVYVTGNFVKDAIRTAQLWKNGETINIGGINNHSFVSDVFVKNNKVYVSYHEANQFKKFVSKLWLDGEITDISDGIIDTYSQKIIVE